MLISETLRGLSHVIHPNAELVLAAAIAQAEKIEALSEKWGREAVSQCLLCCETSQQKADELRRAVDGGQ